MFQVVFFDLVLWVDLLGKIGILLGCYGEGDTNFVLVWLGLEWFGFLWSLDVIVVWKVLCLDGVGLKWYGCLGIVIIDDN